MGSLKSGSVEGSVHTIELWDIVLFMHVKRIQQSFVLAGNYLTKSSSFVDNFVYFSHVINVVELHCTLAQISCFSTLVLNVQKRLIVTIWGRRSKTVFLFLVFFFLSMAERLKKNSVFCYHFIVESFCQPFDLAL